jgi:ABC-type microcin C transport system permease subunit YejB
MSISKRTAIATGAGLVIGLSVIAFAHGQTVQGGKKSSEVAAMGEGEAVMIGEKGERIHKSNVKVTTAQHEAAMKKGAREIKPGAVIYRQGGKLYMLEEPRNETFHDVFENF